MQKAIEKSREEINRQVEDLKKLPDASSPRTILPALIVLYIRVYNLSYEDAIRDIRKDLQNLKKVGLIYSQYQESINK